MNPLWPVALITFKEGVRNRAIYGISIFALLLFGANIIICGMIMQEVGKVAVDMALSAMAFAGLLIILFVGINLMAKDLDRRTIYMVLSRPISRTQYILGKFAGMFLLLIVTLFVLSLFAILSIFVVMKMYPNYSTMVSIPKVFLAVSFIAAGLTLLLSLSFLFASFASTSFITLILTIVTYLIGHSIMDVKALIETQQVTVGSVSPATIKLIQIAYYIFPNLSIFDIKLQAAHNLPISFMYIAGAFSYGIVYSSIVVAITCLIFRKREFP